jgi:hypothetical protein
MVWSSVVLLFYADTTHSELVEMVFDGVFIMQDGACR